jgi:hypothetical protein
MERVPGLVAVWHRPREASPELIAGSPGLPETWGDETVELSGTAFLQVNREAAALLEAHVLERAGDVAGLRVVDAYCGVGPARPPLRPRRRARRRHRAGPAGGGGGDRGRPARRRVRGGPGGGADPSYLPAHLVILNPPRAGIAAEVADALLAVRAERILYISCNPATLARDLKRLSPAYTLVGVRSFDLFPQTAHVESVAELRSNADPS